MDDENDEDVHHGLSASPIKNARMLRETKNNRLVWKQTSLETFSLPTRNDLKFPFIAFRIPGECFSFVRYSSSVLYILDVYS